jgi:hypothetical protein
MKFERFIRAERRPVTGRRLAAAKRALQRQADKVALYPELQPTETPQERCDRFDLASLAASQRWRDAEAERWRRARRELRAMSAAKQTQVDRRWGQNRFMPKTAVYLLETIRAVKQEVQP